MIKKPCKECPWTNQNPHSIKFRQYVRKMESAGQKGHACHMSTSDVWGKKSEISCENVCAGYKLREKKE